MTSVFILSDDTTSLNSSYETIFTDRVLSRGFEDPVFRGPQIPPVAWAERFRGCTSRQDLIELYNHYLVWKHTVETNRPSLVLYNRSFPVQPLAVVADLFRDGLESLEGSEVNLVYYGKYDDRCDLYVTYKEITIDADNPREFVLYRTFGPKGSFAYAVTPLGAQRLIEQMVQTTASVTAVMDAALSCEKIVGVTFNPSIIRLPNKKNECADQTVNNNSFWVWFFVFIGIGIVLGAIAYMVFMNIWYDPTESVETDVLKQSRYSNDEFSVDTVLSTNRQSSEMEYSTERSLESLRTIPDSTTVSSRRSQSLNTVIAPQKSQSLRSVSAASGTSRQPTRVVSSVPTTVVESQTVLPSRTQVSTRSVQKTPSVIQRTVTRPAPVVPAPVVQPAAPAPVVQPAVQAPRGVAPPRVVTTRTKVQPGKTVTTTRQVVRNPPPVPTNRTARLVESDKPAAPQIQKINARAVPLERVRITGTDSAAPVQATSVTKQPSIGVQTSPVRNSIAPIPVMERPRGRTQSSVTQMPDLETRSNILTVNNPVPQPRTMSKVSTTATPVRTQSAMSKTPTVPLLESTQRLVTSPPAASNTVVTSVPVRRVVNTSALASANEAALRDSGRVQQFL